MRIPSAATAATPYADFYEPPEDQGSWVYDASGAIYDHDRTFLHETHLLELLAAIIKRNDAALLKMYLAKHPELSPGGPPCWTLDYGQINDPFLTAAYCGSVDVLNVMLEHWAANPGVVVEPDSPERASGARMFDMACRAGRLGVVRFLTDQNRPWARNFGDLHAVLATTNPGHGRTAIHSAAASYLARHRPGQHDDTDELVGLLLDKGACATDAYKFHGIFGEMPLQSRGTLLSLAVSGASADIIKRISDAGVGWRDRVPYNCSAGGLFGDEFDAAWDVTALHIACLCANADAVQVLHDRVDKSAWSEFVSCRDNHGRSPLHWAVSGIGIENTNAAPQILRIINLLLAGNADINERDAEGDTPLHYAMINYDAETCYTVGKFLLDNGALAAARGRKGETPLHRWWFPGQRSQENIALFKLLLVHGADLFDADASGSTILHAAESANDVEFLREEAGDETVNRALQTANAEGNTPLHVAALRGLIWQGALRPKVLAEDRIAAHDVVLAALTPPLETSGREVQAGDDDVGSTSLLDQSNQQGKTLRQLREESRSMWLQEERLREACVGVKGYDEWTFACQKLADLRPDCPSPW